MDDASRQRGREILATMTGGQGEALEARWRELHPDLADLIVGFVAGEIWARPGLDRKTRSLVTIAVTAALGRRNALPLNIRLALENGATREEIVEVMFQLAAYAGFPAAWDGLETAAGVFAEAGAASR
jgi:4-carboxymuconolactone decarboxylase